MSGRGRDVGGRDRDVGCCGRDLGGRDRSVGGRDRSVGGRDRSMGGLDRSVGGRDRSMGGLDRSVGGRDRSVGGRDRSVGGRDRSGGGRDCSIGGRDRSVGGRVADFVFRRFPSPTMAGNVANRDRTDGAMEQRAAANSERSVPAAVDGLESGSPWADKKSKPRMGLYTAASRKVTKKVRSPNDRRRRTVPQHGMALPSAPEICGPVGGVFERCGRALQTAPVSTINCCLPSSSVTVGMVVVAIVAVLLIRARGRRAGRRAAASVVVRVLPAAAAGNGNLECHVGHVLVLVVSLFFCRHFVERGVTRCGEM